MEDIAVSAHRLIRGPADAAARDAAERQSHRGRALHGSTEHTPDELTRAARSIPHDPVSQCEFWQCISRHVGAGAILTSPDDLPLLTPCGPLPPASCREGWNRTHVKPGDPHFHERRDAIRAHCAATPHRWRHALHVCIENPASSALFLFQLGTIALCNITSIQSITHCAGGTPWKKHTRFATTTCTPDYVCGRDPHQNCGHGKAHELVSAGGLVPRELDDGMDYTTHFITARHYDDLASAMSGIPLADRQWHPIVHLGAGGESSAHLTVHGFPLVTIDIEECTETHFRNVHPTLCTSYDADTPEGFWAVVDRALAVPGFRRQDVAAYLFDPCCVTRTQLNRVNSTDGEPKNRADCGVPHPGQKGLDARTRDVIDEMIIVALDDEVGRSRAQAHRNTAPIRCVPCTAPATALLAAVVATAPAHAAASPEPTRHAASLVGHQCPATALLLLAVVVAAAILLALVRASHLHTEDPQAPGPEPPTPKAARRHRAGPRPVTALAAVLLAAGTARADKAPQPEPTRAPRALGRPLPAPTPTPTSLTPQPLPTPPPDAAPEVTVPRRARHLEPLYATQMHAPGHELQGDAARADLVHSRNTRTHHVRIGTSPQLPNRLGVDWYMGPRVLCATIDGQGNRCQHTGIVCARHLTTGTRRDGRAYCCMSCFTTRGEHHDSDDDHDPETGDRTPRCAQHVNPAVLLAQYGPYQSGPPQPHAPINRALIYELDDHTGSRDRTWIGVPPQHSGLPNHRDSRGPQYDAHTDYAYADAAESADPSLRVGLRDPRTIPDDSSDDSQTSAPDLTIPSVAVRARTYDAGMAHLASHPEAARAATNAQSYAMESPAALRARVPPHLPTTAAYLDHDDDADASDADSTTSTQTPSRALFHVVFQQQIAAGCDEHEASATAFAVWLEHDTRTCPDLLGTHHHMSPQSAGSDEHDADSQASDDTQHLAEPDTMPGDDLSMAMSDATDSDSQADRPTTDHGDYDRPHDTEGHDDRPHRSDADSPDSEGRGDQGATHLATGPVHTPTSPPPQPTLPTPTPTPAPAPTHQHPAPHQRPTQQWPDAPHPPHHEPQTSRASRRGLSWSHALLAAAVTLAPMVRAAHAEAPLVAVRHVGRRGGLTLLSGALLASAAMSCLPMTSSSPVPAPDDDDRRADDPPLTPDRTTGPTDLYLYDTDDGQHDWDDDQSDGADDPAPPVVPPYLPIPNEAFGDLALEPGLPDTANDLLAHSRRISGTASTSSAWPMTKPSSAPCTTSGPSCAATRPSARTWRWRTTPSLGGSVTSGKVGSCDGAIKTRKRGYCTYTPAKTWQRKGRSRYRNGSRKANSSAPTTHATMPRPPDPRGPTGKTYRQPRREWSTSPRSSISHPPAPTALPHWTRVTTPPTCPTRPTRAAAMARTRNPRPRRAPTTTTTNPPPQWHLPPSPSPARPAAARARSPRSLGKRPTCTTHSSKTSSMALRRSVCLPMRPSDVPA